MDKIAWLGGRYTYIDDVRSVHTMRKPSMRRIYWLVFFVAVLELGLMGFHALETKNATPSSQSHVIVEEVKQPTLDVTHQLKGNDLHMKLTVTNFTFSLEHMGLANKQGEGHVHLYVDGKKVAKIFEPQLVYSDLSPGTHTIEVELAHNNHESYGVKKSVQVTVK